MRLSGSKFTRLTLTTFLVSGAVVASPPWQASFATAPTPAVQYDATGYTAGATTWSNLGSTGSAGNGTAPTGGMTTTSSGPAGVIFTGKESSNSDYVSGTLGTSVSRSKVSIEFWLYLDDSGSTQNPAGSMLFSWASTNYNVYHFNNRLGFNSFQSENFSIDATSLEGSWHHYVFVMSNTNTATDQKLYVDGVAQTLTCSPVGSSPNACSDVHTGYRALPLNGNFRLMDHVQAANTWNAKGKVGLVRIYDAELAAPDVLANYNASSANFVDAAAPTSSAAITAAQTNSTSVTVSYSATDDIGIAGIQAFYSTNSDLSSPVDCGPATSVSGLSASGNINCTLASPVSGTTYYFFTRATDWRGAVEAAPTSADDTIIYDASAPTATWTAPSSPANSRTLSYTLAFGESVTGIAASDFSNTGTATDCTFTPSATSGSSITVAVTCTTDGTVIAKIDASSVTDAAGNAGPTAASSATSVTIDTTPATTSTTTTTTTTTVAATTTTTKSQPTVPSDKIIRSLPAKEIVTSETVEPGATLKIAVGGFTPNETVAVGIAGSRSALTSAIADSTGDITARVEIPSSATGQITVFALGQTSKRGFKQIVTLQLPATGTDTSNIPSVAIGFVLLGLFFVGVATRRRLRTE